MYDWFRDAACKDSYDLRFFGSDNEQDEVRHLYCLDCPVKMNCLMLAGVASEKRGLWGGRRHKSRSNGRWLT